MDNRIIEVIARAIIMNETKTKILFCAPKDISYFYLPGGHIEFGETAKSALVRELREETGVDASAAEFHFAGAEEHIFSQADMPHHEINAYFEVIGLFLEQEHISSLEEKISFHWLALADIKNFPVFPKEIRHPLSEWKMGQCIAFEK